MGRIKSPAPQPVDVPLNPAPLAQAKVDEVRALGDSVSDANVEFSEQVGFWKGRRASIDAAKKLLTVTEILDLTRFKASKSYRYMKVVADGKVVTINTFEEFCTLVVGRSREHVDEDIRNCKAFGADFLEAAQNLGVGYRELREMRAIPVDQRLELIEAANKGDKATLIEVAENLLEQNARNIAAVQRKAKEDQQLAAARGRLLEEANAREEALATKHERDAEMPPEVAHLAEIQERIRGLVAASIMLGNLVLDLDDKGISEDMRLMINADCEYAAQTFADILMRAGIPVQFNEMVDPSWMPKANRKSKG